MLYRGRSLPLRGRQSRQCCAQSLRLMINLAATCRKVNHRAYDTCQQLNPLQGQLATSVDCLLSISPTATNASCNILEQQSTAAVRMPAVCAVQTALLSVAQIAPAAANPQRNWSSSSAQYYCSVCSGTPALLPEPSSGGKYNPMHAVSAVGFCCYLCTGTQSMHTAPKTLLHRELRVLRPFQKSSSSPV